MSYFTRISVMGLMYVWKVVSRLFSLLTWEDMQKPPGWSTIARQVALTYTAIIIVAFAAQQAGRPDLIRSPKRVLAHTWEGF